MYVDTLPASAPQLHKGFSISSIESMFRLSSTATQKIGVKDPARIFPAGGGQNYVQAISILEPAYEIFF